MAEEKLLTVREVSQALGISEKEVIDLAESGAIPAYKVGGVYIRFKKEQIQDYRSSSRTLHAKARAHEPYPAKDRLSDFFYFNDFYIFAGLIIALLLVVIFKGY
jgi:excisionase family DNA binding protein